MSAPIFAFCLLFLLCGCATSRPHDEIAQVVSALERMEVDAVAKNRYEEFPYGSCMGIVMPSNAPPKEVAGQALGCIKFAVVEVRRVIIRPPPRLDTIVEPEHLPGLLAQPAHTNLTAVLVTTTVGKRVVLLKFVSLPIGSSSVRYPGGFWVHKTYDPDRVLNQPIERVGASRSGRLHYDANGGLALAAHAQRWTK